jgi:2,4-diaminopentanoate dehydrogenase
LGVGIGVADIKADFSVADGDDRTVAAQRVTVSGIRAGKPIIRYRVNWYCTTEIDRDWELRGNGWRALIEGETPIDVSVSFPVPKERMSPAMAALTAYRVINSVPYVCAAAPGASAPRPICRTSCPEWADSPPL